VATTFAAVPEMIEVEYYRRIADQALDRLVETVRVPDPHCLGRGQSEPELCQALTGRRFTAARRRGKLLLLDIDGGAARPADPVPGARTLGIRFGMTGSLTLDGRLAIDRLLYSSNTHAPQWVRLRIVFADGGELELHDPRRLGRVQLDPDEGLLGPDAGEVSLPELRRALSASPRRSTSTTLKSRLLDQSHLAGLGNLLTDELLWRAALSPHRPLGSLEQGDLRRLHRQLRAMLPELLERGGSHTGDLMPARRPGGRCPCDGTLLLRERVGGRTTLWCPEHQR
jgi:formamidopyrimidine-DNA glycosylase